MSSFNILNYKDIDVNEIMFSKPEKIKGGSYISTPKYNEQPIYIPEALFAEIEQQVINVMMNTMQIPAEDSDNKININR